MDGNTLARGTGWRGDREAWVATSGNGCRWGDSKGGGGCYGQENPIAYVARTTAGTCFDAETDRVVLEFSPMAREEVLAGLRECEHYHKKTDRAVWRLARKWEREVAKGKTLLEWEAKSDGVAHAGT